MGIVAPRPPGVRQLPDRGRDGICIDVMRHVTDPRQHDEACIGYGRRCCPRMDMRRYRRIGAACQDDGGGGDLTIARRLRGNERLERGDVLRIRHELRRPQQQPDGGTTDVIRRRSLGREHRRDAAVEQQDAERECDGVGKQRPDNGRRKDGVVPRQAALPGMRDRRQQHKPRDPGRKGKRKRGCDRSSQRMAEEHEALDADAPERLRDQCRLPCRRSVRNAARPVAPAMSGAVDQDDAAVRCQPVAEGEAQVLEIAAGAMHKHDRELVLTRRGAKLQHMQLAALDLDQAPRSRMGSFDAGRFQDRHRTSGAEDCHNGEKKENRHSSSVASADLKGWSHGGKALTVQVDLRMMQGRALWPLCFQ